MSLTYGYVVATYPAGASVDVLLNKDGSRLSNVQVAAWSASSNTGEFDLPDIGGATDDTRWNLLLPVTRYVRAIIDYMDGVPVCTGFLYPQECQMTFDRKNFKVSRHASDVYSTINDSGDIERYHPSGTYLRIAATAPHEDLTSQDFDQQWAIKKNTTAAVHVHLVVANAGSVVATLDIDPSGNISLVHSGNLTTTTSGNATINVTGTTDINSTGNLTATISGTTTINSTGDVDITAPTSTVHGDAAVTGTATIANLVVT